MDLGVEDVMEVNDADVAGQELQDGGHIRCERLSSSIIIVAVKAAVRETGVEATSLPLVILGADAGGFDGRRACRKVAEVAEI